MSRIVNTPARSVSKVAVHCFH